MDGEQLPEVPGSDKKGKRQKSERGPKIVERNGYWHIAGTLRVARRSIRLRATTGLAATAENRPHADRLLEREVESIRYREIHGRQTPVTFAQAGIGYLEDRRILRDARGNAQIDPERKYVEWFTAFLRGRGRHLDLLDDIDGDVIRDFLKERHIDRGNKRATAERTWDCLRAVWSWAVAKKRAAAMPDFDFDRLFGPHPGPAAVVGKWLYPDEIALLAASAAPHMRVQIAVNWNIGHRMGELLRVSRRAPDYEDPNGTGLCLDDGREHIYLGRTKTGRMRILWLNDVAVREIRIWLSTRKDTHDALFLTHLGEPYRIPRTQRGGLGRRAFNTARETAAKVIEKDWEQPDRAAVMRKVTPHWARHNMTSHKLAQGAGRDQVKNDMGWSSEQMVARYEWDLPGVGKKRANQMQFDTELTHQPDAAPENKGKSTA